MITFKKKVLERNLIGEAIESLTEKGLNFEIISPKDADKVSKLNSKSMVLMDFKQNESGFYQITVKDKAFYSYTKKLLGEYCDMRILGTDEKQRTVTAEAR